MASKNFKKKKIEETQGSGFGQYQEGVGGGGSPQPKDPNKRAPGVNSEYRKENNQTQQPRDNQGHFTYKSVNGQSIDPKYGPSRGKTVNPLLTGGDGTIKISDVEQQFAGKSGAYWNKYKDSWYQKGSEIVTSGDFKVRVAAESVWEVAKRKYDTVKGEFEKESTVFTETKKGRTGAEEKAAIQKAQATGEEQAVIEQSSGGIKLKPGTPVPTKIAPSPVAPSPVAPQPGEQPGATPVIPTAPGATNTAGALMHSVDQLSAARQLLTDNGVDLTGVSDEQLDAIVDDYIDFNAVDVDSNTNSNTNSEADNVAPIKAPVEEKETESESEKKIKKMGFSE